MRAGARADHGLLRLAVREQDRGRDRQDAVPRGGLDVLVDVQLREGDAVTVVAFELVQDRLDGAAGPAPGRPEVDDDGAARRDDLALERVVAQLVHRYRVPAKA